MRRSFILIGFFSVCLAFGSCLKDKVDKGTPNKENSSKGNSNKENSNSEDSKKDTIPVTTSSFSGNWVLVNDTTTTNFWGIWNGRAPVGTNYVGKTADYYNFTSYGKLYIHQDTNRDTETYKLSHDTVLIRTAYIDGQTNQLDSTYNPWYVISGFTAHSCTLKKYFISPETASFSTINLKKQ